MVSYHCENVKIPKINRRATTVWIKATAAEYGKKTGEIAYIFCNDDKILEVNRQYLQHDYFTDIITFDYSEKEMISGDIFISLDTVKSNSEQFNTLYDNELRRVMIHGILHLCGLKDKLPQDEKMMREAENRAILQHKNIDY
ncbi:MAG: rRNA maturation RNase YbeY [Prevotellaceae bacterium]|jgi:rRNA maturation RNase YbeY|nr:rRNA maturation RNase YbeY [Prevotellaceae bacterium]